MAPEASPAPGWYEDPSDAAQMRYWSGTTWTGHTAPRFAPGEAPQSPSGAPQWIAPAGQPRGADGPQPEHQWHYGGQPTSTESPPSTPSPDQPRQPDAGADSWQLPPLQPPQTFQPPPSQQWPPEQSSPEQWPPEQWPPGQWPPGQPPPWPQQTGSGIRGGPRTDDGVPLASWGRRAVARVVDLIAMSFISLPVTGYFLYQVYETELKQHATGLVIYPSGDAMHWYLLYGVVQFVALFCYEVLCLRRWGQTIGKLALGISVRPRDRAGEVPWAAAVRRAGFIYAIELIGLVPLVGFLGLVVLLLDYLRPLWDRRRQALHDHVGGTVVVLGGRDLPPPRPSL